jgi:hypothetical protein
MLLDYCDEPDTKEWYESYSPWAKLHREDKGRLRNAEIAFAVALAAAARVPSLPNTPRHPLAERFKEQADKWERETAFLSATPMRVLHDSYQSIIAMGPEVVPILLCDLQKTRRHWFWALRHLTNADPVPEKDKGNVDKMIGAWLEWGKREGRI